MARAREGEDESGDLARWLEDSGRRRAFRVEDSPEKLLEQLEERAGRALRSREEIELFFAGVESELEARRSALEKRRLGGGAVFVGAPAPPPPPVFFSPGAPPIG